jgi:hypothetical protein
LLRRPRRGYPRLTIAWSEERPYGSKRNHHKYEDRAKMHPRRRADAQAQICSFSVLLWPAPVKYETKRQQGWLVFTGTDRAKSRA